MKITGIDAWPVTLRFNRPFEVWRGTAHAKDHVIVEVHTDEGISGVGEAAPFLYYGPESQFGVVDTVRHHLAPLIIGCDPFDLASITSTWGEVIDGHRFSKAAVEMALWDIQSQALGVPLYRLLGGRFRDAVALIALVLDHEPQPAAQAALKFVDEGYQHLKLKIGFGRDRDIATVTAVRGAIGDAASIRVDAEEAYDLKSATTIARALEELDVELLSQPLPRQQHELMACLSSQTALPILLDESIDTVHDVMTATRAGSGDAINVKLMKSGGIDAARGMATVAAAAGMHALVGSMIESGPATAAGLHVALAHPAFNLPCELVGPVLLADDVVDQGWTITAGMAHPPNTPGLGVVLDRQRLQALRSDRD